MPVNPYNLDMITRICNHLNTACAIITYRHNFHFEYANDLYYQLFKYKRNDGFNYSLPYSNDYQKVKNTITSIIQKKEEFLEIETQSFNKDNDLIWTRSRLSFIYNNQSVYIICLVENITENKKVLKNLEISHQKYLHEGQFKAAIASDALVSYEINIDDDLIIEDIIENTVNMLKLVDLNTNCSYSEFLLRWTKKCVHPDDKNKFYQELHPHRLKKLFEQGITEVYCEYRSLNATQKQGWVSTTIHLLHVGETNKLFGFVYVKDINDKKIHELELLRQSQSDPLTKLYNRTAFGQIVNEYLNKKRESSSALLLIDIDNFKNINDNLGHSFGDTVLCEIAHKLTNIFNNKAIIGRYGGDEFIIFIKDIPSKKYVYHKASIILEELHLYYSSNYQEYTISSSIGITFSPDDGKTLHELFEQTDSALYRAKKLGKSQYFAFNDSYQDITPVTNYISKGWLIDELDEIVYVSSLDTYELLYLNRKGREITGIEAGEYNHIKCYEALQGRTSPCPFCTNAKLNLNEFYIWEFSNQHLNKDYIVKDKLVLWEGTPVRMEIAVDVSDTHNFNLQRVPTEFAIEKTILDCLQALTIPDTLEEAINNVLEIIGNFYQATRAYIVEIDLNTKIGSNTYEWCRENYPHYRDQLQRIDLNEIPYIYEAFEHHNNLIINDCEAIKKEHPREYAHFISREAHSLVTIPYEETDIFAGYIGVDNPSINQNTIALLDSINFSIVNEIKKRRLYEKTQYNLYHDNLSGLLNRNSFTQFLSYENSAVYSQGVILADINGLKEINRDFGHYHGDKIITIISSIMNSYFPSEKIFRLSGDEFIIIVNNLEYKQFIEATKQMDDTLLGSTPNGVSLGYTWSEDNMDINDLIHQAEELMMINKQIYYERADTYKKHYSPKKLENLLKCFKAKQFVVYLQPKFDIDQNKVVSAEALVRLEYPGHGLIMPNKFIPTLEKERMTRYLDFYMFEQICEILERWQKEGKELIPISVNISRLTLLESDFTNSLKRIKNKYNIPNNFITLEITESIGNIDRSIIATISKRIKDLGFNISLDDFGAKYANMSLLSTLNFDELKIDKSMIDTLVNNDKCQTILHHIIEMCKKINVACVAEGVETEKQIELLVCLGCNIIQGFYYSKPIPLQEFEDKYHQ